MSLDLKNDDYIEATKVEQDEYTKKANKHKAIMIGIDIASAVVMVGTSAFYASKGMNPFTSFIKAFWAPALGLIVSNIGVFGTLKKEKAKLLKSVENSENINRGVGK